MNDRKEPTSLTVNGEAGLLFWVGNLISLVCSIEREIYLNNFLVNLVCLHVNSIDLLYFHACADD